MKTLRIASTACLFLALACGSPDEPFDGIFDGSTKSGWQGTGDSSMSLNIDEDSDGNDALSVVGDRAEGDSGQRATFSFKVEPGAAEGSVGVSFRLRGSTNIRFSATTSAVVAVDSGGTCVATAGLGCWDIHGANVAATTEWVTITLTWDQLQQSGAGVAAAFDPAQLTYLNFGPLGDGFYNIWIDDIRFIDSVDGSVTPVTPGDGDGDTSGTGGTPGTGGGVATGGTMATGGTTGTGGTPNTSENALGKYVSLSTFLSSFNGKDSRYTYDGLLAAVDAFPGFASCCSDTDKKLEIAAFMAHVQHESDYLHATDEYTPPSTYCRAGDAQWPCAGGKSYHGRGALQLTWNYNYGMAQDYFSSIGKQYDLLARPEQVSTDEELLWSTALWFWMEGEPDTQSMHDIFKAQGFGATIRKINGALECDGAGPQQVQQRVTYFQEWCARLGVTPSGTLTC